MPGLAHFVDQVIQHTVPAARQPAVRRALARARRPAWAGTLRRTTPLSEHWGADRGTPIDRYYIEHFLARWRGDIQGRVLEVKDSTYTDRFGRDVCAREVVDRDATNPSATIVADLAAPASIPDDSFDCFILTQTLQYISEPGAALRAAARILRPGGVLLATMPGITRLAPPLVDAWHFTPAGVARLARVAFGAGTTSLYVWGNPLVASAFLMGLAAEELRPRELAARDARYPVLIALRAVKRGQDAPPATTDDH